MTKKLVIRSEHCLDDLTGIAKTVHPLAKQLLGKQGLLLVDLLADWQHIIGETMARFVLPQRLIFAKGARDNGTLELLTSNGAIALEVQQMSPQIIEKVNVYFGYAAVAKLKIVQNSAPEIFPVAKNTSENVKKNLVSTSEEIYITNIIKDINDENLRHCLEKLGRYVLSNTKK